MALGNCPECGKNMGMVGRVHKCSPSMMPATITTAPDNTVEIPERVAGVFGITATQIALTNSQRQARWRKAHSDEHKEYMRDYMRKRRG